MEMKLSNSQRHQVENLLMPEQVWKQNPKSIKKASLFLNSEGCWMLVMNDGEGVPATDAEIWMWLRLEEARKIIKRLKAKEPEEEPDEHG